MVRRRFITLDVFTGRRFAGNPLAVVLDAEGLDRGGHADGRPRVQPRRGAACVITEMSSALVREAFLSHAPRASKSRPPSPYHAAPDSVVGQMASCQRLE